MNLKKIWKMWLIMILGWFVFIQVAQAQTPFDFTECLAGTSTAIDLIFGISRAVNSL